MKPIRTLKRRDLLAYAAFSSSAVASTVANAGPIVMEDKPERRYQMKKSINLWAFPYPEKMSLQQSMELAKRAGFDGIELNYDLEGDLSPDAGTKDFENIRRMADQIGIEISGVCSFLFWPYPLTSNDPQERKQGLELAGKMTQAAHYLGTENLLVVPAQSICRGEKIMTPHPMTFVLHAKDSVRQLLPLAEKLGVHLNMENIFFNGFLMSPMEMVDFVDSFDSPFVNVHFDTGNIMEYQFPEHWIPILGNRIKNVHLKEYTKKGSDHSLETFRPLLDGTTNWPAVLEAFDQIQYEGYLTFEYFHAYQHFPEALIYQTGDSLDRMLGIKVG